MKMPIKIPSSPSPTFSMRSMHDVDVHFHQVLQRCVRHLGITRAQIEVLTCVSLKPGIFQSALAEQINAHSVTVAKILDRLHRNDWIRREANNDDRQKSHVFTTSKAEAVLHELWQATEALSDHALDGFTEFERRQFDDFLARIAWNIDWMTYEHQRLSEFLARVGQRKFQDRR